MGLLKSITKKSINEVGLIMSRVDRLRRKIKLRIVLMVTTYTIAVVVALYGLAQADQLNPKIAWLIELTVYIGFLIFTFLYFRFLVKLIGYLRELS